MSEDKPRVGYAGVGLMGHGAAKNILEAGYPLTILGHRNRAPVDDLVARGATEAKTGAELGAASDVVFFCMPTALNVEAALFGPDGVAETLRPGAMVVDSTTADPNLTRSIAARLGERGVRMIDAPLGRSPNEAEAGTLSSYVGGAPEDVEEVRPILEAYSDTIVYTGPLGTGTTCKLVNNFISIGTSALISEAVATAAKLGVDLDTFHKVVSAGGANSPMFQIIMSWVLRGDDTGLKGPVRIAAKDLRTYNRMAEEIGATAFVAKACSETYNLAEARGNAERYMPVMPGLIAELSNFKIRDLD
ncbi:MAG: NAD(P)-dependent oxidoreductase [Bauldia sp.]|uniref:NAD(P)-dependent oxidoreductase n=1 Tax=Bauldia sp. TaxID=2575872 RepID=UPI001D7E4561|nr:NAD(P)-dependent oxidoreductase [Bauldia sp.]MCB1497169.1 NAD(P)-dependent oxidoreductase [Bauldia sp.]